MHFIAVLAGKQSSRQVELLTMSIDIRPFLRNLNYLYRKICDLLLKIMVIIARQIFKISLNFEISF